MATRLYSTFIILIGSRFVAGQRLDCKSDEVNSCIRLADPLLQSNHVFPSNSQDMDHVCNVLFPQTWSTFVECIKEYTTTCLSQDQRTDFNRAVGDSINSVHKMCTNDDYKNDYLRHASCIKEKSVNSQHCGDYYSRLLDMVKGNTPAVHRELCCSHSSFKECVIAETESCPCTGEECRQGMEATGFARAVLDKALGFLLKQCQSYVPDERDCPIYQRKQEKQPRVEETNPNRQDEAIRYDEGSYFPSGLPGRDERREEDWIENPPPVDPPQNFIEQERTTETQTFLDPIIRDTTVNPILEPFLPKQEDERRKPWIPSTDIRSFDDIFNSVQNTQAQELAASGSNPTLPALAVVLPLLILCFI